MSNYTDSLGLEEITPGDQAGLWGTTTNNNIALIDQAVTGVTPITEFNGVSGTTKTLTDFNGAADESRSAVLNITGTATGSNTCVVPNKQKTYLVRNNTGQTVTFQTAVPSATYDVESGNSILIFCDGNNNVYTGIEAPSTGTLGISGGGTGVTTFGAGGIVRSPGGTTDLFAYPTVSLTTEVAGTLPVLNGGTGASTTAGAAFALKGANSDITSLTGLTTPLSATRGGTGSSTAPTAGQVPIGVTGGSYTPGTITGSGGTTVTSTSGGIIISSITGGTGTVTAVSGAGSGLGFSLGGTVTTSGNLTLTVPSGSSLASSMGVPLLASSPTFTGSVLGQSSVGAGSSAGSAIYISTGGNGSAINWYSPSTGNGSTSIFFSATSSLLGNQSFQMAYFGGGSIFQYYGDGNAYKPGGGSWAASSDRRLKENIAPLTGALEKINALSPVSYSWKVPAVNQPTVGFIAQEVQQVMPNAVSSYESKEAEKQFTDGTTLAVGWQNDMTAYLVGAIKELNAKVDAQAAEIAALKYPKTGA